MPLQSRHNPGVFGLCRFFPIPQSPEVGYTFLHEPPCNRSRARPPFPFLVPGGREACPSLGRGGRGPDRPAPGGGSGLCRPPGRGRPLPAGLGGAGGAWLQIRGRQLQRPRRLRGRARVHHAGAGRAARLPAGADGRFYAGIRRALDTWGGEFAGGDYTKADKVFISLSAVGVLERGTAFWTRAGARPGDQLYLTGTPDARRSPSSGSLPGRRRASKPSSRPSRRSPQVAGSAATPSP